MNPFPLSPERRRLAIQRITALWAFCESGLGGVLHALRLPFTGLVVGSFSVLCITMIAWLANGRYRQVLHSLLLALIVKAAVSPHSPPTAYFAVAFQGMAGYGLYRLIGVRAVSVYSVSVLALLESAVQKLLTLTLFFGKSFWKAADELLAFIGKELSIALPLGSTVLVTTYLAIYLAGGIACGTLALRLLRDFRSEAEGLPPLPAFKPGVPAAQRGRRRQRATLLIGLFVVTSIVLYFGTGSHQEGSLAVLQSLLWTATALLLWYGLLAPAALQLLHRYLLRRRAEHSGEVQEVLRLLPAFRQLAVAAWRQSAQQPGRNRLSWFVRLLVHWSLTFDPVELQTEAV